MKIPKRNKRRQRPKQRPAKRKAIAESSKPIRKRVIIKNTSNKKKKRKQRKYKGKS